VNLNVQGLPLAIVVARCAGSASVQLIVFLRSARKYRTQSLRRSIDVDFVFTVCKHDFGGYTVSASTAGQLGVLLSKHLSKVLI